MIDFIIHSNDTNWGHVWHIVTTDGKGMITIELGDDDKKRFYFYGLSVTPDLRRKGVGTELLKAAEKLSMENGGNVFTAHSRDDNGIRLIRTDTRKTVAQAEIQPILYTPGTSGLSRTIKGPFPQVAGNGRGHAAMQRQPYRQIGVVRANISDPSTLRHPIGQLLQPGRQFQLSHLHILRRSV